MRKKLVIGAFIGMLILSITGCGQSDSNKSEIKIASQINVGAGQKVKFNISNYDDLNEISVKVKDDDIATADVDDDTITVEGIEEGETVIGISAEGCDDVMVTVKVDKNSNTAPIYEKYECELPPEFLAYYALSFDDRNAQALVQMAGACGISVKYELQLDLSEGDHGSCKVIINLKEIVDDLQIAMADEDNYIKAMTAATGIQVNDDNRDLALDMQGEILDMFKNDVDDIVNEYTWSFNADSNQLFWGGHSYTLNPDGSFFAELSSGENICMKFTPVK